MASDHLQIPDTAPAQNEKEVTINAAVNLLDRALNGITTKTITVSTSLTATEARENGTVRLAGTPGGAFNLDMPDTNKRTLTIRNETDGACTVRNSAGGGVTLLIRVGQTARFHYDGTNIYPDLGPDDAWFFINGVPTATQRLCKKVAVRSFTIPSAMAGSQAHAGVAATAQTDFDVQKNGSSVGTIRFAAAAQTATFIMASATSFAAGDRLEVFAPGSPDATLADIGFNVAAYLT